MQPYAHLLNNQDWANEYRIVAIDPGSDTLGLTLLTVDLRTGVITVNHSETYHASNYLRYLPFGFEGAHGSMPARMWCHRQTLVNLFRQFQPHTVIAESAFLKKRFPRSFEVLTVGLEMIRSALRDYSPAMILETIGPSEAKKAVGHKGNSSDKMGVHRCVIKYPGLVWNVDPLALDEHSSDSVAIGISKALMVQSEFVYAGYPG